MRHFTTAKLQLHAHLIAAVQKFLTVPDLGQIIVLINIDPKFDLFEFGAARPAILVVLGKVVPKFSKIDNFADRWSSGRRYFYQIEPAALSFPQGIRQPQYPKLLTGRSQNDPNFAGANSTVYTKLLLQIKLISRPT